tara:strand:+ start:215 stop:433 length:219 start_codon:yes stop_codon:yes gene_type:complete
MEVNALDNGGEGRTFLASGKKQGSILSFVQKEHAYKYIPHDHISSENEEDEGILSRSSESSQKRNMIYEERL